MRKLQNFIMKIKYAGNGHAYIYTPYKKDEVVTNSQAVRRDSSYEFANRPTDNSPRVRAEHAQSTRRARAEYVASACRVRAEIAQSAQRAHTECATSSQRGCVELVKRARRARARLVCELAICTTANSLSV